MLFAIIARVRKLAPGARLLTTHRGEATAERLFNTGLLTRRKNLPMSKVGFRLRPCSGPSAGAHARQHHHGKTMATTIMIFAA
jgi:G3E family GTPase